MADKMATNNDWRDGDNGMTVEERAAAYVSWSLSQERFKSDPPDGTFRPLIAFGHACAEDAYKRKMDALGAEAAFLRSALLVREPNFASGLPATAEWLAAHDAEVAARAAGEEGGK